MKQSHSSTTVLRTTLVLFVCLGVLLLGLGIVVHPAALSAGILAPLLMQMIYGASAWFGLKDTRNGTATRFGLLFGALIAIVFAGEVILELLVTMDNNTPLGTAEFGIVFVLLAIAGLSAAWQTRSTRSAVTTAIWAALLGSVVWYATLLATYYLFRTTPQQQHAFLAEGTLDDFHQSGRADFEAFVLQDFWGAGFFHLLLAPIAALIFGATGASVARIGNHFQRLIRHA